ncbi:permease family protein : Putative permease OS=Singulisphaera acidiphila (strain ATCC BAA-1392 / DSM 18658 / VKM B-2454 / MOB10) GN=Sinac_2241 PE=4 SV=1: YjgP_YjgQ [Gemmataceae bacterium]|nr:permease family protein : Putative permease OS=Singulisphaera acidiphila (strain ATCC BAA-1392 / DSM 18658 / VKM B-2454 / MOB10) GN=Sinac_2241 PE=4 SV=1: YjgP_YjgQ [Gemmataceae bacterium]VTU01209.1 permease family protein : Putative permease OS=Singulisphaera acidiphila (strain ATCC BAA-1392 / DSM 18658 / VKM B-2454 / MOB10) GN=Sinac_2241 PE=4 SV=1: YjgP_YjgQ [Gemmataceae bacterium]
MTGTLLNRLIFLELLKVFVLALTVLTGLLVTALLVQQGMQMGLSVAQVVRAIPLFVPNTLPYTIPATTLFASCVVYGRLSHDNEVVAIKAAGVHLFTILKPAILLGVLAAAATAALYHTAIPLSQQVLYKQLLESPEELLYNMLRRDRCIRHPGMAYVMYVRDVQGKRLVDVIIKKRTKLRNSKTGQEAYFGYEVVARAREARLRVDAAEGKLYVDPDRLVVYDKNTAGAAASNGPFPIDLPEGLNGKDSKTRVSAMLWDELPARIEAARAETAAAAQRRQDNLDAAEEQPSPELRQRSLDQDRHYKMQLDYYKRTQRNLEAEYYLRPALAFGCFLFALVGCPIGIWANRADYLSTFVICFLPMMFVYYPILLAGTGMGKDGKVPLVLGCWLANVIFSVIAVALNARLLRR